MNKKIYPKNSCIFHCAILPLIFLASFADANAASKCETLQKLSATSERANSETTPKSCSESQELSSKTVKICSWEYPYRSDEAAEKFKTLNLMVKTCTGENTQVKSDQPVNHPDFYDLKTYKTDNGIVAVSIKDKAALERTFVFLRIGG